MLTGSSCQAHHLDSMPYSINCHLSLRMLVVLTGMCATRCRVAVTGSTANSSESGRAVMTWAAENAAIKKWATTHGLGLARRYSIARCAVAYGRQHCRGSTSTDGFLPAWQLTGFKLSTAMHGPVTDDQPKSRRSLKYWV